MPMLHVVHFLLSLREFRIPLGRVNRDAKLFPLSCEYRLGLSFTVIQQMNLIVQVTQLLAPTAGEISLPA